MSHGLSHMKHSKCKQIKEQNSHVKNQEGRFSREKKGTGGGGNQGE